MRIKSSLLIDEIRLLLGSKYLKKHTDIGFTTSIPIMYKKSFFHFFTKKVKPVGIWIESFVDGVDVKNDDSLKIALSEAVDFIKSILITNRKLSSVKVCVKELSIMDVDIVNNKTHYRFEIFLKGVL